jgi:hypothetical protein
MITVFNGPVEFLQARFPRPIPQSRGRASEDLFSASLDLGRVCLPGKMPVSGDGLHELRQDLPEIVLLEVKHA